MKRTRNYVKRSISAKKRKTDGTSEGTMISPRIKDIHCKLLDCLRIQRSGEAFLKCLKDEECTQKELKEVAQLQNSANLVLLHIACARLVIDNNSEAPIEVLHRLLEADTSSVFAQSNDGAVPLHYALVLNNSQGQGKVMGMLLDADPLKSTLLINDSIAHGDSLLHLALNRFPNEICVSTIKLLYKSERKKEILDNRNSIGRTPIHVACLDDHTAFKILAEDRIHLLDGYTVWRQRLSALISKYRELKLLLYQDLNVDVNSIRSFGDWLMSLFYISIAEIEDELPEVISLLQLAVWKGRGLPGNNAEERKRRWITCGAQHIARGVAEYLGNDSIGQLQAAYDCMKAEAAENHSVDANDSDDDSDDDDDDDSDDDE